MEKRRKNKKFVRMISVIAVLLLVAAMFAGCGEKKGYRLIQVYEVNGTATLERENVGDMDAYENLSLISGDFLSVLKESYLRLKMDEDKYMLVEEDSELSIYSTGTAKDSKTDIQLQKGAVTVEMQGKLTDESSFEITTPNSVMAVRGTVFRVSVGVDEFGKPITKFKILEGSVKVQKIDADGKVKEEVMVPAGKEAIVYDNADTEERELVILEEVDTTDISSIAFEFLKEVSENGRELCITTEEITELITEAEEREVREETGTQIEEEEIEDADSSEIIEDASEAEEVPEEKPMSQKTKKPKEENKSEQSEIKLPEELETIETETVETETVVPEKQENVVPEKTPEQEEIIEPEITETEKPEIIEPEIDIPKEVPTQPEVPEQEETPEEPEMPPKQEETPEEPEIPSKEEADTSVVPKTYKVTFMYEGTVFGTQEVQAGGKASEPKMIPAPSGKWDFDFNTVITEDTTIEFIEETAE